MTGFYNNVNAITEKIANGSIKVTREGNKVTFSGSTYDHKDFLKSEFGCRWDRDSKSWVTTDLSETKANLLDEMMGVEQTETVQLNAENTIDGTYTNARKQSTKPIDQPTGERVAVELDGKTYERTVYERIIWRNMGESTVDARFVIVNGINYLV